MSCEHRCDACRLDRIEEVLVGVLSRVDAILAKADIERARENAHYRQILERLTAMANQIDQFRDELRDNTDAVSVRMDALIAEIKASADNTASPSTLADLEVISAHLKAMGTNPSDPIPQLAPRRP